MATPEQTGAFPFIGPWFPVVTTAPAPGAQTALVVTGDPSYVQEWVAVAFTLTTDGNVANRIPIAEILDGDGVLLASFVGPTIANTSATVKVSGYQGQTADISALPDTATMGVPRGWVFGGYKAQVRILNMAAGDAISNARVTWKRHVQDWTGEAGFGRQGPDSS